MLPCTQAITDWLGGLHLAVNPHPAKRIGRLDQAALLFDVLERIAARTSGLLSRLPVDEPARMLPWCLRLGDLLEEFFRKGVAPKAVGHVEGQLQPWAAALLEQLDTVYAMYVTLLRERGLTTPGLSALDVSRRIDEVAETLNGRRILAAGFYALAGVEDVLLHGLWKRGLCDVVWHSDPALAEGSGHWCLREQKRWLQAWKAKARAHEAPEQALPAEEKPIRFYEGFDLHSQLAALESELAGLAEDESAAVILPEQGMLVPVLHHLPERDVNVSMGYPLARTALWELVETIMRLQQTSSEPGRYYWKDFVSLIRHPYLKMLEVGGERPLRIVFRHWETMLRAGEKYVDPRMLSLPEEELPEDDSEEIRRVCALIVERCLDAFAAARTLGGLSRALVQLGEMLLRHGGRVWKVFLIDAECLHRLLHDVAPALRDTELADEELPLTTLGTILEQLAVKERVAFEAEPLIGLQVLGFLEARLLGFERLYILGANESNLPGNPPSDPLLPDALRHGLGLADSFERDYVGAYNFYRLVNASREVVILYESGVQPGLLDDKAVRSRFTEQLLWAEEQRRGALIKPGDEPLRAISYPVVPHGNEPPGFERSETVDAAMRALLTRPISPTMLDAYLRCPARFVQERLLGLREKEEVDEEGSPLEVGMLVHETLNAFYESKVGCDYLPGRVDALRLADMYEERLRASELWPRLSADRRLVLLETGRHRLATYMEKQKVSRILGVEQELEVELALSSGAFTFRGRADRIDRREETTMLLDYKTGAARYPMVSFWSDEAIWEGIEAGAVDAGLLERVADKAKSLQMPLYGLMYGRQTGTEEVDAAIVELGSDGAEKPVFGSRCKPEQRRERIFTLTERLAGAILGHMLGAESLPATQGRHCSWCPFRGSCGGA
jgi:RecB family exonuclease